MATQLERIASLESDKKWHWVVLTAVVVVALGWLTHIELTLNHIATDQQAIKQKLADGPLGPIVSRLEKPQSTQQLKANLDLVASTIAVDRAQGRPPQSATLMKLSSAVREATLTNPTVEEGWKAAFQLISYRSENNPIPAGDKLGNCLVSSTHALRQLNAMSDNDLSDGVLRFNAHDCVLDLSDTDSYQRSGMKRFFDAVKMRLPRNGNYVVLTNAIIKYSGEQMIPIERITFTNCVFDFTPAPVIPPASGRSLTDQLLASDLVEGSVHIATGM